MNLILFLGSGISLASGHPSVADLTDRILYSGQSTETAFLRALKNYDEQARLAGGTYTSPDKFVNVGEAYRDSTTYEDLYYLCEEIALFDWGLHNNAMVPAFMESLCEAFSFLKGTTKTDKFLEIGRYAHTAKAYINRLIVAELLLPETNIAGLDLIVQLAKSPEVSSLDILTLNHDLLVEGLLLKNGIPFADGFGTADGDMRWFEPDNFLSGPKVKLIKLHGSVDWYSFAVDGEERIAKIAGNSPEDKKNRSGKSMQCLNKSPKVLSGLNKINYYNSGMYTDLHYHFQRVLYQNNLMIMSGYGWGDDPINNRLMTWLDKKRSHRLILLHENPKLLMDRSMVMDRDFSTWEKLGKLKPILKWLSDASLEEVLQACS